MQAETNNSNLKGLLYSILIHGLLMLAAFFSFINIPFPKEETETGGIVINYGTSEEGMGTDFSSLQEPAIGENISENIIEDPNRPNSAPIESDDITEGTITQDFEDAPEVKSGAKKNIDIKKTEKTTSTVNENPQPVLDNRALFKGKKNNGTGTGDGNTKVPGNQGKENGSVLSNSYEGDGNGNGGLALNLDGRRFMIKPSISDKGQLAGKIVVQISVNKDGEIIDARPGVRGTTITNSELWAKCEKAVRSSKLNALASAPDIQVGTVVFTFILK